MKLITNSKGRTIASVGFDEEKGEWRINIYDAHGFATQLEAWNFWHARFDPETGMFIRAC